MYVRVYAREVHACQIGFCFVMRLGAELTLGLSDAGVLHQNQCFTKKRKVGIFIFSKRAAFFSLVNSLNKIYGIYPLVHCL